MKAYSVSLVLIKRKSKGQIGIALTGSICEAVSEAEALGKMVEAAFREIPEYNLSNYVVIEASALKVKTEPENVLREEPEPAVVESVFPVAEKEPPASKTEIKEKSKPDIKKEPAINPPKQRGRPSKQQAEEKARIIAEGPRKYLSTAELSAYMKTGTLPDMPGVQAQPKKFVVSGAYVQGRLEDARILYRKYLEREVAENVEDVLTWGSWIARKFNQSQK